MSAFVGKIVASKLGQTLISAAAPTVKDVASNIFSGILKGFSNKILQLGDKLGIYDYP